VWVCGLPNNGSDLAKPTFKCRRMNGEWPWLIGRAVPALLFSNPPNLYDIKYYMPLMAFAVSGQSVV